MGIVGNAVGIQGGADGGHHPVHHAAGGNDVGPGLHMGKRDARQHVQGLVVQQVAFREGGDRPRAPPGVEDSAMAVIRVFAQTYVRDQQEPRAGILQLPQRALDDPVFGVGLRAFAACAPVSRKEAPAGIRGRRLPAPPRQRGPRRPGTHGHGSHRISATLRPFSEMAIIHHMEQNIGSVGAIA